MSASASDPDAIRQCVSAAYGKLASRPAACCGPPAASGCNPSEVAGYCPEQLAAAPPDAGADSLGCGNPLAFSDVQEGEVVLDLGSGAGLDLIAAARKVGPSGRVIGVDMTPQMLGRAWQNIAAAGLSNVEVRKGLIEDLPVESASVDWVISNCVINLSPDKPRVFAEIARVLKPGGRMRVADIVVEGLPDWARRSEAVYCACIGGAISPEEYLHGLRSAGLVDVEIQQRVACNAAQLRALLTSDVAAAASGSTCGCGLPGAQPSDEAIDSLTGKVFSALFCARKPTACQCR